MLGSMAKRMDEEERLRRAISRGAGRAEVARLLEILDAKERARTKPRDPRLDTARAAIDDMYERWRVEQLAMRARRGDLASARALVEPDGHDDPSAFEDCPYGVPEELDAVAEEVFGNAAVLSGTDVEEEGEAIYQLKAEKDDVWIGAMLELIEKCVEKKEHAWFGCSWGTGASLDDRKSCDCPVDGMSLDERRRMVADAEYEGYEFEEGEPEDSDGWQALASTPGGELRHTEWWKTVYVRGEFDPEDADTKRVTFFVGFAPNSSVCVFVRS